MPDDDNAWKSIETDPPQGDDREIWVRGADGVPMTGFFHQLLIARHSVNGSEPPITSWREKAREQFFQECVD